ncbi:hypothetical protein P167DRAFT_512393 [Morchella conica CCBAS932]|uniref:C2 domain protein n=1 Tax=Morchella conica CCBAS932 TaxID=1392247 RepID=A0A3N4KCS2_9PEZI|nr:hypothetical protein P167DRAFT_512393 [Morchella conica CCBAS932]
MTSNKPYSGSNPIPKVSDFLRETAERVEGQQKDEQAQIARERKGVEQGEGSQGNRRTVTDPTTGKEVVIEDTNESFLNAAKRNDVVVPNANLTDRKDIGDPQAKHSSPTQSQEEYAKTQDVTAPPAPIAPGTTSDVPIHGEKTNILFHPTPSLSLRGTVFHDLEKRATTLCGILFVSIVVLGRILTQGSIIGLLIVAAGVSSYIFYWTKNLVEESANVDWETEKRRGQTAVANLIPESVEWMNTLLGLGWNLVNPEMFSSVADLLEDVMQASVPGVIENVRVADISQGSNPLRILSLRALPDVEVADLKRAATSERGGKDQQQRLAEEEGGEVYNLEASFAYHAAPTEGRGVSKKAKNMHLQVEFYLGIKGLFGVPVPIWVELKSLVGTVRLRLQLTPDPPFLRTLTFTLMGTPQVAVSCIPMVEWGINVLNLPVISQFVNASIATAANEYVAPKSMSLEIGKMLLGDDVKKEVDTVGILWVRIKKAVGLSKQDKRGSSDAYITLAYSKYEKPMYSTRVIVDDLNPIWEESTALLVKADHIKANEALSVELWDSDRLTADDMVGKVEIPLRDLMLNPGRMHEQVSTLTGAESGTSMPGKLYWEVGFFGKPDFRPALRTSGKDVNLPDQLKDRPELQDDQGVLENTLEDAVMHTPPDPLFPSGIVSLVVHQIVNLEIRDLTGNYGNRKNGKEYSPGMETGEIKQEEGGKLPSAYCTIAINDQLVYRTRSKVVSSKPIFNAGTERFIRDWRSAIITVTVRDQRYREHDPILGVVPLKLSDILQTNSEVTRWFPLDGGIGFGRIRLSLLFRSVELTLPRQITGWDVGTFEFTSETLIAESYPTVAKIKLRTGGSTGLIPRKNGAKTQTGAIEWALVRGKKEKQHRIRLPVRHRYMSPITFDFYDSSHNPTSRGPDAHATLWLDKLVDNEPTPIRIPIFKTSNSQRFTQNRIESVEDDPSIDLQQVGTLVFSGRFKAGMDEDHERFATDNDSRETFETWAACRSEGIRGTIVHKETNPIIDELHDNSISQMRGDLADFDKGPKDVDETNRLTDRYGKDWAGVFEAGKRDLAPESRYRTTDFNENPNQRGVQPYSSLITNRSDYSDSDTDSDSDSEASSDSSYHHVTTVSPPSTEEEPTNSGSMNPIKSIKAYRENQKTTHRKHRGLMQWKPMRSIAFAKDEMKFAGRKLKAKTKLTGREPDVETEV